MMTPSAVEWEIRHTRDRGGGPVAAKILVPDRPQ